MRIISYIRDFFSSEWFDLYFTYLRFQISITNDSSYSLWFETKKEITFELKFRFFD